MSANYFDEENEVPRIQDAAKYPGIQHKDKVLENKILKLPPRVPPSRGVSIAMKPKLEDELKRLTDPPATHRTCGQAD